MDSVRDPSMLFECHLVRTCFVADDAGDGSGLHMNLKDVFLDGPGPSQPLFTNTALARTIGKPNYVLVNECWPSCNNGGERRYQTYASPCCLRMCSLRLS